MSTNRMKNKRKVERAGPERWTSYSPVSDMLWDLETSGGFRICVTAAVEVGGEHHAVCIHVMILCLVWYCFDNLQVHSKTYNEFILTQEQRVEKSALQRVEKSALLIECNGQL